MERSTYWMQWVLTAPETGPQTAANQAGNPPAGTPEVPRAVTRSWPLSTEMAGGGPTGAPAATATCR